MNKVIHGDCLEVMKDIPDKSIDMILCDLPYGTTDCSWDTVIPFESLWEQYKRIVKDNACICLFGSQPFTTDLINSNRKWYRYNWIWIKNMPTGWYMVDKTPMNNYETISVFYKNQCFYNPQFIKKTKEEFKLSYRKKDSITKMTGEQYIKNKYNKRIRASKERQNYKAPVRTLFFSIDRLRNGSSHPTQKPVKLFEYLIKTYTDDNDIVLDNCIGSGTTAVACIKTGRQYIGIEKEKKYIDICHKRIRKAEESVSLLKVAENV